MSVEHAGTFLLGGDLPLPRLGFGAMRLCGPGAWGEPTDRSNPARVLRRAVELGVRLIDTADAYGPEVSEYTIANTLFPYEKGLVVATKGGFVRSGPGQWQADGRPEHLHRAVRNSLRRLRLERIDLYQLHAVDRQVPLEDSVGELARAREEGLIRHIGLCNVSLDALERARQIAPIASVQNRYNVGYRKHEAMLARCAALGMGFIPWFPLGASRLCGATSGPLADIARQHGVTTSQIALAWLLARSPVMLPIPGTSRRAHLEENGAAGGLVLSTEDLLQLEGLECAPAPCAVDGLD